LPLAVAEEAESDFVRVLAGASGEYLDEGGRYHPLPA
jgi:hypothetical protein